MDRKRFFVLIDLAVCGEAKYAKCPLCGSNNKGYVDVECASDYLTTKKNNIARNPNLGQHELTRIWYRIRGIRT